MPSTGEALELLMATSAHVGLAVARVGAKRTLRELLPKSRFEARLAVVFRCATPSTAHTRRSSLSAEEVEEAAEEGTPPRGGRALPGEGSTPSQHGATGACTCTPAHTCVWADR